MTNADLVRHWRIELAQEIVAGKQSHELESETRLLEDYIEQHHRQYEYVSALWVAVGCAGHNGDGPNIWKEEWRLIRATPQQRAQAFLQAMEQVE